MASGNSGVPIGADGSGLRPFRQMEQTMGMSAESMVFHGWVFKEGHRFPWGEDGDAEEWWRTANGYEPPFKLYTKDGEHIGGVEPPHKRIDEYYDHRRKWDEANPMPFELVNCSSCEYPIWALAIGKVHQADWESPRELRLEDLKADPAQVERVKELCVKHRIRVKGEPKWYLAAYWG